MSIKEKVLLKPPVWPTMKGNGHQYCHASLIPYLHLFGMRYIPGTFKFVYSEETQRLIGVYTSKILQNFQ